MSSLCRLDPSVPHRYVRFQNEFRQSTKIRSNPAIWDTKFYSYLRLDAVIPRYMYVLSFIKGMLGIGAMTHSCGNTYMSYSVCTYCQL